MSETQLVDVDGVIPETPPEVREEEEEAPVEVAPPIKRGRGRPPGAKNKKQASARGVSTSHARPGASDASPQEEA